MGGNNRTTKNNGASAAMRFDAACRCLDLSGQNIIDVLSPGRVSKMTTAYRSLSAWLMYANGSGGITLSCVSQPLCRGRSSVHSALGRMVEWPGESVEGATLLAHLYEKCLSDPTFYPRCVVDARAVYGAMLRAEAKAV